MRFRGDVVAGSAALEPAYGNSYSPFVGPIKRSGSGKRRSFVATPQPVPLRLNRPTEGSCNVWDVGPIKRSGSGKPRNFVATPVPVPLRLKRPTAVVGHAGALNGGAV